MKTFSIALISLLWIVAPATGQAAAPVAATYQQNINRAPTATNVSLSAPVVGPTNPLTISAVVSYPTNGQLTGNALFTVLNGTTPVGTYPAPVTSSGIATISPSLSTGTYTVSAAYPGDPNLLASTSEPTTLVVLGPADFSFSAAPLSVTQGATGTVLTAITALNGFHGPITFTCVSPIERLNCGFASEVFTVPAPTGQITPSTPAGSTAFNVTTFPTTVVQASLAGAFLLGFMSLRRRRTYLLPLALTAMLLMAGCGTGTKYLQTDGTPKGTYAITVTGTSGTLSHTQTVLVTVR